MESIAFIDRDIDINKNPPTPGKIILQYFPEDYMKFNQPLCRQLFIIEENNTAEETSRQDQDVQENPGNNQEEEEAIVVQPARIDRVSQKRNFSVLPRDTRPIAIPKFRSVNRGVFFENSEIKKTQTSDKKNIRQERRSAQNLDMMEEKLKGVLEQLKSRPKKDDIQGKRKAMIIDVIQPSSKKRRAVRLRKGVYFSSGSRSKRNNFFSLTFRTLTKALC
ncbi:hypothetical protein KQX54_003831 [Cotesia glomerata]|uniref:Uncharacterized protein n=1 Tax=Cotesia glomerata TaxID=32391 RepID=A0AAV7IJ38_COTGL|nr:hypothetical protein KQX54_003831 [Cotesia glomerata]